MSDDDILGPNTLGMTRRGRLSADVTALMLKGAAYAAIFCFVVYLGAWVLLGISAILPEDSKFAPDPNPDRSHLELVAPYVA